MLRHSHERESAIAETARLMKILTRYVDALEIVRGIDNALRKMAIEVAEASWENEGGGLLRGPLMCELPSTCYKRTPKVFKRPFATSCEIVDAIKNDYVSNRKNYVNKGYPYDYLVPIMIGKF